MNEYERMIKIMEIERSMGIDEESRYRGMKLIQELTSMVTTEPVLLVEVVKPTDVIEPNGITE